MALGVSAAILEAEPHWRAFINSLKARGIGIPDLVTRWLAPSNSRMME
jgi:hypothetical protein